MYKQVYLKRGKEESLLRFHPWIFSGAINKIEEGLEEGDIVRVMTHDKKFIAVGHFQIGSIAIRVLSFHDVKIDDKFWESRLKAALQVRQAIGIIREEINRNRTISKHNFTVLFMVRATIFQD